MSSEKIYLVIRSDRSVRAVKRLRLAADEIAIPVILDFPATWGRVLDNTIQITVPDFVPDVRLESDDPADSRRIVDVELPADNVVPTPYDNSPRT